MDGSDLGVLQKPPEGTPDPVALPPKIYTRDGFAGSFSVETANSYAPDYLYARGPHVPRRSTLSRMTPGDESDPEALPTLMATSNGGLRFYLSGRSTPMTFVVRNVDAEELHFVQEGEVDFETEVGWLTGKRGDFICIPKSIAYRTHPLTGSTRTLIIESTSKFKFVTPYPVGMLNRERDLEWAKVRPSMDAGEPTRLLLKDREGDHTSFMMAADPLALKSHVAGATPVWKLPMDKVQTVLTLPNGGPPFAFLSCESDEFLVFNLGSRPVDYRPPVHLNADYDEIMVYVDGAPYGACEEPGVFTWVPKGVIHQGVAPNTPEPHRSWLLETRSTLRLTQAALAQSHPMETGAFGVHDSGAGA